MAALADAKLSQEAMALRNFEMENQIMVRACYPLFVCVSLLSLLLSSLPPPSPRHLSHHPATIQQQEVSDCDAIYKYDEARNEQILAEKPWASKYVWGPSLCCFVSWSLAHLLLPSSSSLSPKSQPNVLQAREDVCPCSPEDCEMDARGELC